MEVGSVSSGAYEVVWAWERIYVHEVGSVWRECTNFQYRECTRWPGGEYIRREVHELGSV